MASALFRADASVDLGGGHIMRCRALAEHLRQLGWTCIFAWTKESPDFLPDFSQADFDSIVLHGKQTSEPTQLKAALPDGIDWLVCDHYGRDALFETECREWAKNILAIDDLADRKHDSTILLDSALGRRQEDYDELVPLDCRMLIGPQFSLLRRDFVRARQNTQPRDGAVDRIVISFGMTDPHDLTSRALESISRMKIDMDIDVFLGRAAPHRSNVARLVAELGPRVCLRSDPRQMIEALARADLAIGAAGSNSWERCCLGVPSLVVVTAENQRLIARSLAAAGVVKIAGDVDVDGFSAMISELVADRNRLIEMSQQAFSLCDGYGTGRVSMAMISVRARDGARVELRPVGIDDEDLMFAWQTIPGIRLYFNDPVPPDLKSHRDWFRRKVRDPQCSFNMILHGNKPVGFVRFDCVTASQTRPCCEISILVIPEKQGLGIAQAAMGLLRVLSPDSVFRASVHSENAASHALFHACGFEFREDGYYLDPGRGVDCFAARSIDGAAR